MRRVRNIGRDGTTKSAYREIVAELRAENKQLQADIFKMNDKCVAMRRELQAEVERLNTIINNRAEDLEVKAKHERLKELWAKVLKQIEREDGTYFGNLAPYRNILYEISKLVEQALKGASQ